MRKAVWIVGILFWASLHYPLAMPAASWEEAATLYVEALQSQDKARTKAA
jgi:hypothetical protein